MTEPGLFRVVHTVLDEWCEPAALFRLFYAQSPRSVWLDDAQGSGYSIMADDSGPQSFALAATLSDNHRADIGRSHEGDHEFCDPQESASSVAGLLAAIDDTIGQFAGVVPDDCECPFRLGWLGWFGYECGAALVGTPVRRAATPDAALIFADRALILDHGNQQIHVRELHAVDAPVSGNTWARWIAASLAAFRDRSSSGLVGREERARATTVTAVGHWHTGRDRYQQSIRSIQHAISAGDVYQVCLTNELRAEFHPDALDAYERLRCAQPTPLAAFVRFDETAVLSASPEQFVSVSRNGRLTVRPIKGTSARKEGSADRGSAHQLVESTKERAENLMIVDLMRNDLARVSVPGSTAVAELFAVESYTDVHQLVSTVIAQRAEDATPGAVLAALLPGGSMTGAPKHSAMSIIDDLEQRARGVYSGALGFIGIDGELNLAMVIRTAVLQRGTIVIGAGGGITAGSDPDAEWAEVVLKAAGVARALSIALPDGDNG